MQALAEQKVQECDYNSVHTDSQGIGEAQHVSYDSTSKKKLEEMKSMICAQRFLKVVSNEINRK